MARGWESKSIEAQQAEASEGTHKSRTLLSPEQQAILRQAEGLELSRKSILRQLESASNARHRRMLEDALAELDRRLTEMRQSQNTGAKSNGQ
jgi:hypothetical protein